MGGFFLAEKEGRFTDRDEALLALFAQQAAAAIANARAYGDERVRAEEVELSVATGRVSERHSTRAG